MENKKNPSPILRYGSKDMVLHDVKTAYQGFFRIDEYQLSHQRYDGTHSQLMTREIFERGDAVVLIPYDIANDTVVLLEQFRPGAIGREQSPWLLEFIAGMFDASESPIDVAIREAKEEANLTISAEQITPVMQYLSSPGGTSEQIHVLVAQIDSTGVSGIHGLAEEGEDILVHVIPRTQALELLENGEINNAATIIGLQWLAMNYQKLMKQSNAGKM